MKRMLPFGATRASVLLVAVFLLSCGRSGNETTAAASSEAVEDPCAPSDRPVRVDRVFTRGTGEPAEQTAEFAASVGEPGQVCATAADVNGGEVSLNGDVLFDSGDLNKKDPTLTAAVTLEAANTLRVKLLGKPCKKPGKCATLRIQVFGSAPPATPRPIHALAPSQLEPLNCCLDPKCDRDAFKARGGVCPDNFRKEPEALPAVLSSEP